MIAGTNSRKRGRELTSTTAAMNPLMSIQSQPQPQLIDLTQLHTSPPSQQQPPNLVSTGLRLAFGDQHQLQQQHHHHHSLSPQSSQSSAFYSILTEDLATHIKQQRDEIDHLLLIQVYYFCPKFTIQTIKIVCLDYKLTEIDYK